MTGTILKPKNKESLNQLIQIIKDKQDWTYLTRDIVSRLCNIPMGARINRIVESLRYSENIIYRYEKVPGRPFHNLYVKYVSKEERVKYGIKNDQFYHIPEEDFNRVYTKIKNLFLGFDERVEALRVLDILYWYKVDNEWIDIDFERVYQTIFISLNRLKEIVYIFVQNKILYTIKQVNKYRVFPPDVSDMYIKEEMARYINKQSGIEVEEPKKEKIVVDKFNSPELNELLSMINSISAQVVHMNAFINSMAGWDKSIANSEEAFMRLNTAYSLLQKKNKEYKQRIDKLESILQEINEFVSHIEEWPGNTKVVTQEIRNIKERLANAHDKEKTEDEY